MKKYFLLLFLATLLFSGCNKNKDNGDGAIYGTLKDSNGDPVANVEIVLFVSEKYGSQQVDQQVTKDSGTYYFWSLRAGNYRLQYVYKGGMVPSTKRIDVVINAGESKKVDLLYAASN